MSATAVATITPSSAMGGGQLFGFSLLKKQSEPLPLADADRGADDRRGSQTIDDELRNLEELERLRGHDDAQATTTSSTTTTPTPTHGGCDNDPGARHAADHGDDARPGCSRR